MVLLLGTLCIDRLTRLPFAVCGLCHTHCPLFGWPSKGCLESAIFPLLPGFCSYARRPVGVGRCGWASLEVVPLSPGELDCKRRLLSLFSVVRCVVLVLPLCLLVMGAVCMASVVVVVVLALFWRSGLVLVTVHWPLFVAAVAWVGMAHCHMLQCALPALHELRP